MVDIYIIFELNYKTRQWVAIECSSSLSVVIVRIATLRSTNGDKADYKIEYVPETPA